MIAKMAPSEKGRCVEPVLKLAGRCSCGISDSLACARCGKCPCIVDVIESVTTRTRICTDCRPSIHPYRHASFFYRSDS